MSVMSGFYIRHEGSLKLAGKGVSELTYKGVPYV